MANITTSGIMGFCVGDALGVPYEFETRESLDSNPTTTMRGYGTYNLPKGTWSDDTSMVLCATESLINGLDYKDIAKKFSKWLNEGYMTPHGEVFDVGNTTRDALSRYSEEIDPIALGKGSESDLGNGSLMRILPVAYYLYINGEEDIYNEIHKYSSITHSHKIAKIACTIYSLYVMAILDGASIWMAYTYVKEKIKEVYPSKEDKEHLKVFSRILDENIALYTKDEIKSSGYVVDTLEAVFWSFLNGDGYEDAVLKAVNLGEDTDTIAALVGGLAGIYYGYEDIPSEWINSIVKKDMIEDICDRFYDSLINSKNNKA